MSFAPPPGSARQLAGIPFSEAVDTAAAAKQRYDAFDGTPDGHSDPSLCKAILQFPAPTGAVFWSSKMAIDADGPAAGPGRLPGSRLDPGNGSEQDFTTFAFTDASGKSIPGNPGLSSELVPYVVLPKKAANSSRPFHPDLAIGDVAVVIFKDRITSAICGDLGPHRRIGEASIRVHEALRQPGVPDPCSKRDANGWCLRTLNASVEEDVLTFVFPGSGFAPGELTPQNINTKVAERAYRLFNQLRGSNGAA